MERVLFPDVTLLACDIVRDAFNDIGENADVVAWVPSDVPTLEAPPVVTIVRIGGVTRQYVFEDADVSIDCWHDTHELAHDLCQQACAALRAARGTVVDGVPIYRVTDVAGPTNAPDPDSGVPRYTATLTLTVRGASAIASS